MRRWTAAGTGSGISRFRVMVPLELVDRAAILSIPKGPNPMAEQSDQRRAPRIKTDIQAFFSSGRDEGPAVLADFSSVGALLEETPARPRVGTRVRVTIFLATQAEPLQVAGNVVRHTEAGFAMEFDSPAPHLYSLVVEDNAAEVPPSQIDPDRVLGSFWLLLWNSFGARFPSEPKEVPGFNGTPAP